MRVAILSCRKLPSFVTWEIPDADALFADDRLLIAAFDKRGVSAESVVWSDPDVDWDGYDVALIRSTWDYIDERELFLSVLSRIEESSCRLFNPLDAVRWNSDKSYLFDLSDRGVPIVPTLRASSLDPADFHGHLAQLGWQSAIVKPVVGVGASGVRRMALGDIAGTLTSLADGSSLGDYLVQPLVESVITEGEWSFVFVAGEFGHALLKKPAAGDYRSQGIYGGTVEPVDPRPEDIRQAEAILAALPYELLYARLDLVRIDDRLAVMELELIEPILYFGLAPRGPDLLASATIAQAATP